jgi:hypothetical protein
MASTSEVASASTQPLWPHNLHATLRPSTLVAFSDTNPRVPRLTGVEQSPSSSAPTGLAGYGGNKAVEASAVTATIKVTRQDIGPHIYPNSALLASGHTSHQLNAVPWIPGYGYHWTQASHSHMAQTTRTPKSTQ